jgi:hypothetical protein
MANKKSGGSGGQKAGDKQPAAHLAARALVEAARLHQDELLLAGLHVASIDRLAVAAKGLEAAAQAPGEAPNAAIVVLDRDIRAVVGEFQSAIRREFPSNASFQAFFRAQEPLPDEPRALLALGRELVKVAPDFAANLIKHAVNAASVKQLAFLCDQLEQELGGADPEGEAREAGGLIREAARRAFEGRPELAAFGESGS